ncbi:MAG: aspartate dehydrogenase domain-containing protein [Paracoccaceae bacterium]
MATLGLIGFGALGQGLVAALAGRGHDWVLLRRPGSTRAVPDGLRTVDDLPALLAARPAAVIEAAGQSAVAACVPAVLRAGIPVVLASTGALSDAALRDGLLRAAQTPGARLVIPSGAIAGLDYLRAVAPLDGVRIRYTSRKPVAAWAAELAALGLDPGSLRSEVVLFDGTAEAAALRYPRNLNVALTLALTAPQAGLSVRVLADPAATGNGHEIDIDSPAGSASFRMVNAPAPGNPKTSLLTGLSLRAAVEELLP